MYAHMHVHVELYLLFTTYIKQMDQTDPINVVTQRCVYM